MQLVLEKLSNTSTNANHFMESILYEMFLEHFNKADSHHLQIFLNIRRIIFYKIKSKKFLQNQFNIFFGIFPLKSLYKLCIYYH